MTRYNPEPCRVVNITGSDIKVETKNGNFLCRNKSFFKRLPKVTKDSDHEEDDEDDETSWRHEPRTQIHDRTSVDHQGVSANGESQETNLRRSNRIRFQPDRYGDSIPSEVISNFL